MRVKNMKRIKIYSIIFLFLLVLLTGCSKEKLIEEGTKLLDKMFASDSSGQPVSSEEPPSSPSSSESETAADSQNFEDISSPGAEDPPAADPPPIVSEPSEQPASKPESSQAAPAGSITPSHTDVTFFGPGESFRFIPKGVTGVYACTYASEDETIASVDSDTGKVTAVGRGTTKIKMHVESGGQYDFSCIVRCSWTEDEKEPSLPDDEPSLPPVPEGPSEIVETGVSGISASHSDATFFNPEEHFRFLPIGAGNGSTCTYMTDNAEIASVDDKGVVTAVGPGTTTVTMTVDAGGTEYIFKCIVRCSWN